MNATRSLLFLALAVPSTGMALQAIDDQSMAAITGQAGITIEQTTTDETGRLLTTGEIRYTQKNDVGEGEAYLAIESMNVRAYTRDEDGGFVGLNTIKQQIDIDELGNLSIKTKDINTLEVQLGEVSLSGRKWMGGIDINVWKFAEGSYLETEIVNSENGPKIISRNVMKEGSGYNQRIYENDVIVSSDVVYLPKLGEDTFISETILTNYHEGNESGLKLEIGKTEGTMEIRNLSILNQQGENIFGEGNSFGDLGYGNIRVEENKSYVTMIANRQSADRGLRGKMATDFTIGESYFRTTDARLNAKDVHFKTTGEIDYSVLFTEPANIDDATNFNKKPGIITTFSGAGSLSLSVGALTLSAADGSAETPFSAGSFAINNLQLNGGELTLAVLPDSTYAEHGTRQLLNATHGLSFDLEVVDDKAAAGQPQAKFTANIAINNFTQDQITNYTKTGIRTYVRENTMDMNINAIKVGNNQTYQGQSGRLVMDNYHQMPGSYTNIEPLR